MGYKRIIYRGRTTHAFIRVGAPRLGPQVYYHSRGVEPMIGTEFVIQRWCTEQVAGCTNLSGLDRAHRQDGLRRKFIVESMHQASKAWVAS